MDRKPNNARRKIILLSCSAHKLECSAPAKEIYESTLFQASLRWAQQQEPDAIYILSAKHHLLELDGEIAPYDLTLNEMSASNLRDWAGAVMKQLKRCSDTESDQYVILAGEKYRRYLLPHLKHVSLPLKGLPIGKQIQYLQQQLTGGDAPTENEKPDCRQIHHYLTRITRHRFPFNPAALPDNGIYILFEQGESAHGTDRIVRIGTHRSQGQLPGRLREHFVTENKDRSIFRKNIGRALLNRDGSALLKHWEVDLTTRKAREQYSNRIDAEAITAMEHHVSHYIQENLSFCVIEIPDNQTRMRLETGLIATLNACPNCQPSPDWLGRHSPKAKIRQSGLWLVQGLGGQQLAGKEWALVRAGRADDGTRTPQLRPRMLQKHRKQPCPPAGHPGKYAALMEYLSGIDENHVTLSFSQLEEILGFHLPRSARKHRPWWANHKSNKTSPQSNAWQQAGFEVDRVSIGQNGSVRFRKESE